MRQVSGVGVGFRRELAGALLAQPESVGFVEVVAEACRDPRARREAVALSEVWPVVPHGVKLSLGSAEGIDDHRIADFVGLARAVRAPLVSEHVAFVRSGGREIGHLTELPRSREAVRIVARNVARLRRALGDVPLLLENVARAGIFDDGEMGEGDFYAEIVRATGCPLLLDVGNLYANAVNAGRDPADMLREHPLEAVAMLHVAGGIFEDGFYFDTHAHPVPGAVFALVARVLEVRPDLPILLERDGGFDRPSAIFDEVGMLAALRARAPRRPGARAKVPPASAPDPSPAPDLRARQDDVACRLTDAETPANASAAIARARTILERKRADDALPLLPELGARVAPCEALALGGIAAAPRLPSLTAVADAMRIARAARAVPRLHAPAAHDDLLLRARFMGGPDAPKPRSLPFVGSVTAGGRTFWAIKGFGTRAEVRLLERGASR